MKVGFVFWVGMIGLFALNGLQGQEPLRILTSDFPPYTVQADSHLGGMSTEVVQAVLAEAGMKATLTLLPWARAYERVEAGKADLIYSMVRTPQREGLFTWVGVIAPNDIYLIALASRTDIVVGSLEDARRYRIGTTINDVREQYLISKGFTVGKELEEVNADNLNIRKLLAGRIDLIAVQDTVAYAEAGRENLGRDKLRKVFRLADISSEGQYLAARKSLPEETVTRLKTALGKVKAKGLYAQILAKYN